MADLPGGACCNGLSRGVCWLQINPSNSGNLCLAFGDPDAQPTVFAASDESEGRVIATTANPIAASIADASMIEGNGIQSLEFTVSLTAPSPGNVSVDIQTVNESATALQVDRLATGLTEPIYATHAPGDPETLFVVEQDGVIKRVDLTTNTVATTPFLTVTNLSLNGERGLLGLAFHPEIREQPSTLRLHDRRESRHVDPRVHGAARRKHRGPIDGESHPRI